MNDCPLLLTAYAAHPDDPAYRAIACVLETATARKLHGFAQWLGLEENTFWKMLMHCFPGASEAGWKPDLRHDQIVLPCEFTDLTDMLLADRSDDMPETFWAAHALACGCFGNGHLWHDMGLTGREEVSSLLQRHFTPLFNANTSNMKWKKFFYHRVCERLDIHPCPEPSCAGCDNYVACHGAETIAIVQHPFTT